MRRFLIPSAAAVALAAVLAATPPAAAQTSWAACGGGEGGARILCPVGSDAPGSGARSAEQAGGGRGGGSASPSDQRWDPHPTLVRQPDGSSCIGTEYRPVPVDTPPPDRPRDPNMGFYGPTGRLYLPCPPASQAAYAGAAGVAMRAWEEVPLPVPNPKIAPGRAITGLWAYLETRNQTSFEFRKDTLVGALDIRATGSYSVDWGDGETSGPHGFEGKAWPDGEIRHQYIDVGSYDVVVTERWTAAWQLGPWSGTLGGLRTVGRIDDFPVQQIQAVIVSSLSSYGGRRP